MSEKVKLPKGWEVKKLGEVCLKVEAVKRREKSPDDELIYLDIGGINNLTNKVLSHKNFIWENAPSRAQQIVYLDDILFSTVRTYMKNIAIVENQLYDGQIASSGFCVIRANKKIIHPKFIFYYSLSQKFLQPLNELQTGSSYPAVRDKDVFSQLFSFPPLSEQTAIVSKIEELLSDLENGKQQLLTAQAQLKVYRQSLLKWAFEGKLTNKNVKEGELPKGWKTVKITDIVENNKHSLKAGPFGSSLKKEFYVSKGYKIYGQEQVIIDNAFFGNYYVNEEKYEELKSCRVKPLDILISLVGTVGKVLILPENCELGVINPRLIKISINKDIYLHKFFKYYFESSYVKNFYGSKAQGTTMDVLNLGIIKTIPFPLPPLSEQTRIIEELESKLTICDNIDETISQSLLQAETLRQSILKKAFEGKLV